MVQQLGKGLCATVILAVLIVGGVAHAADGDRAARAAAMPDWDGVWARAGGALFDPAAQGRDHPPYKPDWEAGYRKTLAAGGVKPADDALMQCLPRGVPAVMAQAGRFQFVLTPDQVWIMAEAGDQTRRIYTDGRAQLGGDDLFPTYTGNSVGHWEGDTLVVLTAGLRDDMALDRTGAHLSGEARVTERIRMATPTTMQDRITIDDPVALTRPWTVVRTYRRAPAGVRLADSPCHDHHGKLVVKAADIR